MTEVIGLTAEMYQAVITIVDERVKEIRVTREDFNALKGAVQELAQAQARTEQQMGELVQVQARAMLPGYLERHFGLVLVQLGINPSVVIRGNLTHKTSPGNHRRISASMY